MSALEEGLELVEEGPQAPLQGRRGRKPGVKGRPWLALALLLTRQGFTPREIGARVGRTKEAVRFALVLHKYRVVLIPKEQEETPDDPPRRK